MTLVIKMLITGAHQSYVSDLYIAVLKLASRQVWGQLTVGSHTRHVLLMCRVVWESWPTWLPNYELVTPLWSKWYTDTLCLCWLTIIRQFKSFKVQSAFLTKCSYCHSLVLFNVLCLCGTLNTPIHFVTFKRILDKNCRHHSNQWGFETLTPIISESTSCR